MRTLKHEARKATQEASETVYVYRAPGASHGIVQQSDRAGRPGDEILEPDTYKEIARKLAETAASAPVISMSLSGLIKDKLDAGGINSR